MFYIYRGVLSILCGEPPHVHAVLTFLPKKDTAIGLGPLLSALLFISNHEPLSRTQKSCPQATRTRLGECALRRLIMQ